MRGSAALKSTYAMEPTVEEKPLAVIEFNANCGVDYDFVGSYDTSTIPTTHSTSGGSVVGAVVESRFIKRYQPTVDASIDSLVSQLQYVDVIDKKYPQAFPISSIFEPSRPGPGIVKLAANSSGNSPAPSPSVRIYPADEGTEFKYWRSPKSSVRHPFIKYTNSIWINKIKVVMQNYAGVPSSYRVQVLPHGSSTWTNVWTQANGAFPSGGMFKIYYYDGSWTATPSTSSIHEITSSTITNAVRIHGLRVLIDGMPTTAPAAEFIEISPRLSVNVTDSLKGCRFTQSISEDDSPLPVGTISANDAALTIEDYDGLFDFDNASNVVYNHNPRQGVFDLYFSTKRQDSVYEVTRSYYGIIDKFTPEEASGLIEVRAYDSMYILQNKRVDGLLLRNAKLSTIVRTILDTCGISDMTFLIKNLSDDIAIPYYYTEDQTGYEALADLAEAYQIAMSFDSDNVLVAMTKEYMSDSSRASDFVLTLDDRVDSLSNIKDMSKTDGRPVNEITVSYKNHFVAQATINADVGKIDWYRRKEEKTSEVWASDGKVLGVAPLVATLPASGQSFVMVDQEAGRAFDWTGHLLIDQEVIAYDAKQFHYKPNGGSYTRAWITSQEEYDSIADTIAQDSKIYFTGALKIPSNGRARFSTVAAQHTVDTDKEYPYSAFRSWKTCPYITTSSYKERYGDQTWRFKSGKVINLRGTSFNLNKTIRNGSFSAIRITGVNWSELRSNAGTSGNVAQSSSHCLHLYLDGAPTLPSGKRIVPYRVGAGIGVLGRMNGANELVANGVEGLAGVAMFMGVTSGTGGNRRLSGWGIDIRPSAEQPSDNVRIVRIVDDTVTTKAKATWKINARLDGKNPSLSNSEGHYHHVELAYFPSTKTFVGFVDGKAVVKYTSPTAAVTTAWYGPYVRGSSTADFDYVWWSDRSDPVSVNGLTLASSGDPTDFSLYDAKNGAAGPPVWWEEDTRHLFDQPYGDVYETMGLFEFGPLAHEVDIVKAQFDSPVINPRPVVTFYSGFRVPIFRSTPFEAEAVIVNAKRHAVSTENFKIVGRAVETSDESFSMSDLAFSGDNEGEVALSNATKSRALFGSVPMEVSSPLIQTKFAAKNLLQWVLGKLSKDCEIVEAEMFGLPLIEPGDVCSVYNTDKGLNGTKFVVVSVENSWSSGLSTSLTLRRL